MSDNDWYFLGKEKLFSILAEATRISKTKIAKIILDLYTSFGNRGRRILSENQSMLTVVTGEEGVKNIVLTKEYDLELRDFGIPKSLFETTSEAFRRGFIDAMFSSDGCVGSRGKQKGLFSWHWI